MIPPVVVAVYPQVVRDCTWTLLPSGGGLSGGRVWRGECNGEPLFALKRWPTTWSPVRMRTVHDCMRQVEELNFVARLLPTLSNTTVAVHDGCCWDVTRWQPGTSDLLSRASPNQLRAAGTALADLHRRWLPMPVENVPCAVVARRLRLLTEWERARFQFTGPPAGMTEVGRSVELVRDRLTRCRGELLALSSLRRRPAGIHGDYWPENVLFQHDRVTAVLDFGNVGFDHPEVDLGRLFADVPGADRPMIVAAVEAYNAVAPLELSVPTVEMLASSGRLCSLANWHLRLNVGSPDAELLSAALPRVRRLAALLVAG